MSAETEARIQAALTHLIQSRITMLTEAVAKIRESALEGASQRADDSEPFTRGYVEGYLTALDGVDHLLELVAQS